MESRPSFSVRWYRTLANWKLVLVTGVLYFLSQILIGHILERIGPADVLALQTTFSAHRFLEILGQWGERGVSVYMSHFTLDFIHPVWYALFLSSFMAWLTARPEKEPSRGMLILFFLPYVAGACDLIENTIHVLLLRRVVPVSEAPVFFSALCANTKWLLAGISVIAVLALGVKRLFRKR